MQPGRFALLAMFSLIGCAAGAMEPAGPGTPADDESALRHLKTVLWPRSYREQDTALLDRILDDRFQMLDAEGARSTKREELEYIRHNKPSYRSFRFDIERLEVFEGRFAVVDGKGTIEGGTAEKPTVTTYRSSNYFIKNGGMWRAIASHVSGVVEQAAKPAEKPAVQPAPSP